MAHTITPKKYRSIPRYITDFHTRKVPFNPSKKGETEEHTPMLFFYDHDTKLLCVFTLSENV